MLLAERIQIIKNQIREAEKSAGRDGGEVKLIAVSKNFSTDFIREAHDLGLKSFGENYVQEALPKLDELKKLNLDWHYIGHLQTNKAKFIADRFALIQTIDSEKIAIELSKRTTSEQKILIEVDLAGEETKTGCAREELAPLIEKIQSLPHLRLQGLMFMAPLELTPSEQQKYFVEARQVRDQHLSYVSAPHSLIELSMGTSHDFEVAIKEGATMVRIGTAIFGERDYE